jgi:phage shock protein PspC (stress-responsive transcriptional regulator)
MSRRLERSATNRVISGVCGGLAEYLAVDPTLVRVFFVICTIITAFAFILVYIALLVLMPLPGERPMTDDIWPSARTGDPTATGPTDPSAPHTVHTNGGSDRGRNTIGYVLVALGLIFLLSNAGAFRFVQWQIVWPLVLVAIGVLLLVQRTRP